MSGHPLSLRIRLMAVGLVGLGLAIGIGSVALYGVLWFTSLHSLDRSSTATATEVVSLVQAHRLPEPIPVAGTQIVQVVDAHGRVVSASDNADQLTTLLDPSEVRRAESEPIQVAGSRIGLSSQLRVIAVHASGTSQTVVVAQQTDEILRSVHVLRTALLLTFPALLLVLGLIAWRVIGATLRPVEELRAGAERISGSGRDDRLPVSGSADEVQALAITLNSMLDRLAGSRERQRSFVADVAHELRSPLASMRTQLEVAERLGEGGRLVDDLHLDVMRMSALVEDLLTLARLDADAVPLQPSVALDVRDLLVSVTGQYAGRRVPVTLGACDSLLVGSADPAELSRVLGNLIENALRFARTRIVLSAARVRSRVVVRIDDDGPGIERADRARVLQRFTRLDDARDRDAGGSGLGLAIVSELVARRGGEVRLSRSPYAGLRVEVTLPDASADDLPAARGAAAAADTGS